VMGVDVDETGRDHLTGGVDLPGPPQALPHPDDPATGHGHVGPVPGGTGTVDERAAPYNGLAVHGRLLPLMTVGRDEGPSPVPLSPADSRARTGVTSPLRR